MHSIEQIARTPDQIGSAIRRKRKRLGLSQKQLSEKTNLRQATISGIETGEINASLKTICSLLAALDLEFVVRERSRASLQDIADLF